MTQKAELREWSIVRSYYGIIIATGKIYNDATKRFPDGEVIRTSVIVSLDVENNLLQTKNSLYTLA